MQILRPESEGFKQNLESSRATAFGKRDQPARIQWILGGAAGNSALRRFRCVEGVVVAGEILPVHINSYLRAHSLDLLFHRLRGGAAGDAALAHAG